MKLNVVELAHQLCQIPSVTSQETEVVFFVEQFLSSLGFHVRRQQVGSKPGRDNLLIVGQTNKPRVLLSTHLDTVPPFFTPSLSQNGEWLLARGACDAKGIAASMIAAFLALAEAKEHAVGLLFVVGEETDSDGAKACIQGFAPQVEYIIDGEPTEMKLVSAMKGAIVFDLLAHGKAGHSAYPQSGESAVHQLIRDVHQILNHAWPKDVKLGETTVNVGVIEGGRAPNVIADSASARLVMRTTVGADLLLSELKRLVSAKTQIHVRSTSSPQHLHVVSGFDTGVVAFGSDVPYLAKLGKPLLLGPGSILDAHTADEKIKVADLISAAEIYKKLCQHLLHD